MQKLNFSSLAFIMALTAILLSIQACGDEEYPTPVVLTPLQFESFYDNESVTVSWQWQEGSGNMEMQMLSTINLADFDDLLQQFLFMDTDDYISLDRPYQFQVGDGLDTTVYFAFRLRAKSGNRESNWSEIRYFQFEPIGRLETREIRAAFDYDFTLEVPANRGDYITIQSLNVFNIDEAISQSGIDINQIEFIRPDSGYVEDQTGRGEDIDYFVFGYGEPTRPDRYPFRELGFADNLMDGSSLYYASEGGGYFENVYPLFTNQSIVLKGSYYPTTFRSEESISGVRHNIRLHLILKAYLKGNP